MVPVVAGDGYVVRLGSSAQLLAPGDLESDSFSLFITLGVVDGLGTLFRCLSGISTPANRTRFSFLFSIFNTNWLCNIFIATSTSLSSSPASVALYTCVSSSSSRALGAVCVASHVVLGVISKRFVDAMCGGTSRIVVGPC